MVHEHAVVAEHAYYSIILAFPGSTLLAISVPESVDVELLEP